MTDYRLAALLLVLGVGVWYNNFMRLYHGSQNEFVTPKYGLGQDQHDFGRGFYLTDTEELAKEWAVYKPKSADGWVHTFDLDLEGLRVLDYRNENVFAWIAELMRHRDADESAAYRRRAPLFIEKYCVEEADDYDVVIGWRANASYFYIVKAFVRGEIDPDCLPELLKLGGFGIQYVVRSAKAYERLQALVDLRQRVSYATYHEAYEDRDSAARRKMYDLIEDPEFNRLRHSFNDLIREG